jgi:hypothetical protein
MLGRGLAKDSTDLRVAKFNFFAVDMNFLKGD